MLDDEFSNFSCNIEAYLARVCSISAFFFLEGEWNPFQILFPPFSNPQSKKPQSTSHQNEPLPARNRVPNKQR